MRVMMVVGMVLLAGRAWAGPGDLQPRTDEDSGQPLVVLDAPAEGTKCVKAGALCFSAGARGTIAVESQVAAAAPDAKPVPVPVTPRFARATSLAARDGGTKTGDGAWTLDVASTLKRPSWAGNALFMLFDLDDPDALPNRQFTALYQQSLKAAKTVAARLTLTPDEGFRAGHTYRLRIVQLVGGKEILLAEGDVTLL
jgi:hypothetical protein